MKRYDILCQSLHQFSLDQYVVKSYQISISIWLNQIQDSYIDLVVNVLFYPMNLQQDSRFCIQQTFTENKNYNQMHLKQ